MSKLIFGLLVLVMLLCIPITVSADTGDVSVLANVPATVTITWVNTCNTWSLNYEANPNLYKSGNGLCGASGLLTLDVSTNMRWDFGIHGTNSGKLTGSPGSLVNAIGFKWLGGSTGGCTVAAGSGGSGGISGSATPYCFTGSDIRLIGAPALDAELTQNMALTDKAGNYAIALTATVVATT